MGVSARGYREKEKGERGIHDFRTMFTTVRCADLKLFSASLPSKFRYGYLDSGRLPLVHRDPFPLFFTILPRVQYFSTSSYNYALFGAYGISFCLFRFD